MKQKAYGWIVVCSLVIGAIFDLAQFGSFVTAWNEFTKYLKDQGLPTENSLLMTGILVIIIIIVAFVIYLGQKVVANEQKTNEPNLDLARKTYLDWFGKDVNQRLKSSIHQAVFIELGTEQVDDAVLPWHYEYKEDKEHSEFQTSDTIDQIIAKNHKHILLLGSPGAGKSTTLLNVAVSLHNNAQANENEYIPVLLNLSTLRIDTESKIDIHECILKQLMGIRGAGVCRSVAKNWIENAKIWLLLDGLDEVAESQRGKLVTALNAFLQRHAGIPVIICSRSEDYNALVETRGVKLELEIAVKIQPLSELMIDNYLQAANAHQLKKALETDRELKELAATPLELSIMVLAYSDSDLSQSEKTSELLSKTTRRMELFEAFVSKMVQRKARRDSGNRDEVNLQSRKQLKTPYSISQINRYLGWLAQNMSQRSHTSINFNELFEFIWPLENEKTWCALTLTRGVITVIFSFVTVLALAGSTDITANEVYTSTIVALLTGISFLWFLKLSNESIDLWEPTPSVLIPTWFLFLAIFSFLIISVNQHFSWPLTGYLFVFLYSFPAAALIKNAFSDKKVGSTVAGGGAIFTLVIAIYLLTQVELSIGGWYLLFLVTSCLVFFEVKAPILSYLLSASFWGIFHLSAAVVGVSLLNDMSLLSAALFAGVMIAIINCDLEDNRDSLGLSLAFVLGALLGGRVNPELGVLCGVICGFVYLLINKKLSLIVAYLTRVIANPIYKLSLATTHKLPFKSSIFIGYCIDSLILKDEKENLQFMHRRLRDYFAVREVFSLLPNKNNNRGNVAAKLAALGDASCDVLIELTNDDEPIIRQTCIKGLAGIGSLTAAQTLITIIQSTGKGVRNPALESLSKIKDIGAAPLLYKTLKNSLIDSDLALANACFCSLAKMDMLDLLEDEEVEVLVANLKNEKSDVAIPAVATLVKRELLENKYVRSKFKHDQYTYDFFVAFAALSPEKVIPLIFSWNLSEHTLYEICKAMDKDKLLDKLISRIEEVESPCRYSIKILKKLFEPDDLPSHLQHLLPRKQQSSVFTYIRYEINDFIETIFDRENLRLLFVYFRNLVESVNLWIKRTKILRECKSKLRSQKPDQQIEALDYLVKSDVVLISELERILLESNNKVILKKIASAFCHYRLLTHKAFYLITDEDEEIKHIGLSIFRNRVIIPNNNTKDSIIDNFSPKTSEHEHAWNLAFVLSQQKPAIRSKAKKVISRSADEQFDIFGLSAFLLENTESYLQNLAASACFAADNAEQIVTLLKHPSYLVRHQTINHIKHQQDDYATPALVIALQSDDSRDITNSLEALQSLDNFYSFNSSELDILASTLSDLLGHLPYAIQAADILWAIKKKDNVASGLLARMNEGALFLELAEQYLCKMDSKETIDGLIKHTRSEIVDVKLTATRILGKIGHGHATNRLFELLDDTSVNEQGAKVSETAEVALTKIGTQKIMMKLAKKQKIETKG